MKWTQKSSFGFTLIEVLVVVSIIGILSALIYANFNEARNDAKNRAWQTELKEVQLAIELYKSQNGVYPLAQDDSITPSCGSGTSPVAEARSSFCGVLPVVDNLVPEFISELPKAETSSNSNCDLVYRVDEVSQSWYKLIAENCLTDVNAVSGTKSIDDLALCPSTCVTTCGVNTMDASFIESAAFYETLAVYSEGGRCR